MDNREMRYFKSGAMFQDLVGVVLLVVARILQSDREEVIFNIFKAKNSLFHKSAVSNNSLFPIQIHKSTISALSYFEESSSTIGFTETVPRKLNLNQ